MDTTKTIDQLKDEASKQSRLRNLLIFAGGSIATNGTLLNGSYASAVAYIQAESRFTELYNLLGEFLNTE